MSFSILKKKNKSRPNKVHSMHLNTDESNLVNKKISDTYNFLPL